MTSRPHLFIATPCYGGLVTQSYLQSILALQQHAPQAGYDLTLALLAHDALISRARNTLVGQFLAEPRATHLFFIDSDIGFTPDQVSRLVEARKDIVAGLYPLKTERWDEAAHARLAAGEGVETAGLVYVGEPCQGPARREENGFVTADYAGTGFMLIQRHVIERMIAAYPETRYRHAFILSNDAAEGRFNYALFDTMIDPETEAYLSEDYTFCRRWRLLGGTIWLDLRAMLSHTGAHEFRGNPALRLTPPYRQNEPPSLLSAAPAA
jgi:hypothetical protein